MLRYLETFYRHRLVILAPLVFCLLASLALVVVQPRMYTASTKLWADKPVIGPNSAAYTFVTPADQRSAELAELIHTRYFCLQVGSRGPLRESIASTRVPSADPVSNVLGRFGFPKLGPKRAPGQDQVDDSVFQAVSTRTTVESSGPQIVSITFADRDPTIAAGTAKAIVEQFVEETLGSQRAQTVGARDFYDAQVKQASSDLSLADGKVFDYLTAHPDQRVPNAVPDAKLLQLRRDDDQARQRYESLLQKLDDAKLNIAAVDAGGASGIRVIDPAEKPKQPASRLKAALQSVGGGVAVGLMLAIFTLLALTLADTALRQPDDVERTLDLRLVGTVPRLKEAS